MRTIVYIDGFNLYYGACRAPGRRWLDVSALAARLLPEDEIEAIGYFTANIKKDRDVEQCQFPAQVISPKGAKLVKPASW